MEEVNKNYGKSRCCKAEVEYSGGGYDGEDVVPVISWCTKCDEPNPGVIMKVGRPVKLDF